MTLKTKSRIAISAVAVVVMLLPPTRLVDTVYYYGYVEAYPVAKWVLPITVAIISFLLLADWVKALIAGAISFGITMFMFGLMGIGALDCGSGVTSGYGLSQACGGGPLVFVKIGLVGLICLNLFLLYRIAFPKAPKTPRGVQAK